MKHALAKLQPCADARERGKQMLSRAVETMNCLSEAPLPAVDPPLDNAGKIVMDSLHGAFYHHRELLYARRALACSISRHAAALAHEMSARESAVMDGHANSPPLGSPVLGSPGDPAAANAASRDSRRDAKPAYGGGGPMMAGPLSSHPPGLAKSGSKKKSGVLAGPAAGGVPSTTPPRANSSLGPSSVADSPGHPSASAIDAANPLQRVKALMLLTPSPELLGSVTASETAASESHTHSGAEAEAAPVADARPPVIITPERVADMCETLGIDIRGSEPEYQMLWLAVEAICTPLPPLWRRLERPTASEQATAQASHPQPGSAALPMTLPRWAASKSQTSSHDLSVSPSRPPAPPPEPPRPPPAIPIAGKTTDECYYYEHSVTGVVLPQHPLLPAFFDMVAVERRRKERNRPWRQAENWMLFAAPESNSLYFYNFATGQRSRVLPGEIMAEKMERMRRLQGSPEERKKAQQARPAPAGPRAPVHQHLKRWSTRIGGRWPC